jgi:hypothetical protein
MTSPHPHTAGRAESPRAVETNGIGQATTSHLNLTRTMADQVATEVESKSRHVTYSHEQRSASHG